MRGIVATLAIVWRIASPYFRSEDRWPGRMLLAAVIGLELSVVALTVLLNTWNNVFYNALQDRNWAVFVYQLGYFCVLADRLGRWSTSTSSISINGCRSAGDAG